MGVLLVVTAPPVFTRSLNVVACAVAVLCPRVANVSEVILNFLPDVTTKLAAVLVDAVPDDLVSVIAVSVVVVPDDAAVAWNRRYVAAVLAVHVFSVD